MEAVIQDAKVHWGVGVGGGCLLHPYMLCGYLTFLTLCSRGVVVEVT